MAKKNKKQSFEEDKIINIKVENKEQIISSYSYDENDKLDKNLSEYIIEKTKRVHLSQNIKLNFYSKEHIEKQEIVDTINNHFNEECLETKDELKKTNIFTISMLVLGILTFAILVALYNRNFNMYFEMILEIATWVFIWEAVDSLFLQRPKIKRKYIQIQKLCSAQVEIFTTMERTLNVKEKQNSK